MTQATIDASKGVAGPKWTAHPYEAFPDFALLILLQLHELCRDVFLAELGNLCPACR